MSVGRTMDLKDFRAYVKKLRKQLGKGADSAIVKGIHSGVMKAVTIVHKSTDLAMPASPNGAVGAVDTGGYKQRWQFKLGPTGGSVFNNHPAADVIEHGRRANRKPPPLQAIERWAQRRLGLSAADAKLARWPIAKAIGKRGLVGRRVLTNPLTKSQITRAVMDEVKKSVHEALHPKKGTP